MAQPVSVRLSDDKWRAYSEQAQAEGIGLSTYLKRRLERGDQVVEQLAGLRRVIEALASSGRNDASADAKENTPDSRFDGILLELLLLMRSAVGDAKISIVHGELRRQNLPIWTGDKGVPK